MDRFPGMGGPPPPQPGGAPGGMTFAQYLGQRAPQLIQQIGAAAGQGGGMPMGGPPGMPPMGGPPPMMGGGMMPPQAQAMAMQDPMYQAGRMAAQMMGGRGLPGGGAPPMGGPPGMPPR